MSQSTVQIDQLCSQMNFRSVAAIVSCYCFIIVAAVIGLGLGALLLMFEHSVVLSKGGKPVM